MKFKSFKKFLEEKGVTESEYQDKSPQEMATLHKEYNEAVQKQMEEAIIGMVPKEELNKLIEEAVKDMNTFATPKQIEDLTAKLKEQGEALTALKVGGGNETLESQISKFIKDKHEEIKTMKSKGQGVIELEVKAPATITTGNATQGTVPAIVGVQQAPPSNVNLRNTFIEGLTTKVQTNLAAFPYTETIPKEGDFEFVAEGEEKPQIDFRIETEYAQPKKIAAYVKLTDEAVTDIPQLESIARDYLRKKHDLKKQKAILFGDGTGANPTGATEYARTFNARAMAGAVVNPNFMDIVNAVVTDIFTTHNYEDEMEQQASLAVVNPMDFFLNLVSAKDANGRPLYPTASLFNQVNIGGLTIIPDSSIEQGKIFVADMSKYNLTDYVGYTVKIGWVNDDFIRNQFVMLAESRFHAFVKNLDQGAFIYDDIEVIRTAIEREVEPQEPAA